MNYAKVSGKAFDIEPFHDIQDRPCTSFWIRVDEETVVPCLVIGKTLDIRDGGNFTAEGRLEGHPASVVMEARQ